MKHRGTERTEEVNTFSFLSVNYRMGRMLRGRIGRIHEFMLESGPTSHPKPCVAIDQWQDIEPSLRENPLTHAR